MRFDPKGFVASHAQAHTLEQFPNEACGLIIGGNYHACMNVHPEPARQFRIRPEEQVHLAAKFGSVQAVLHSHAVDAPTHAFKPGFHPDAPSRADMQGQIRSGWPWGILVTNGVNCSAPFFWGNFTLDLPLAGQSFRHGQNDCYTAIRRWHWQTHGRLLPEFPRDDEWWLYEEDLYMTGFQEAGFRQVSGLPEPGDVYLMKIRSQKYNHGFVYAGDGLIYHHLSGRLSRHEPGSAWINAADIHLRY